MADERRIRTNVLERRPRTSRSGRRGSPARFRLAILLLPLLATTAAAQDGDVFHRLPLPELPLTSGESLAWEAASWRVRPERASLLWPRIVVDGPGEAHVVQRDERSMWSLDPADFDVVARAPAGTTLQGWLFVPDPLWQKLIPHPFELPPEDAASDSDGFLEGRERYYDRLLWLDIPGAAWFRYQRDEARAQRSEPPEDAPDVWRDPSTPPVRSSNVVDTFDLFAGGRAVSENLALDRLLPPAPESDVTVDVDSIQGITIPEYDWAPLLADPPPALDSLAWLVPADQHVLLLPSFEALVTLADESDAHGTPVLQALQPRAVSALTRDRTEHQLGLPMSALSRLLGPHVIASVAFTGADPYLRTGADIAMLFEAVDIDVLLPLVQARVALAAGNEPRAEAVSGELGDIPWTGFTTPDRAMHTHVAAIGDTVVVTNSLAQLERLVQTAAGERESLAALPEFAWFRQRYPLGDASETGLLVVSDATIRRWCGPRWRIGASRRVHAGAVLADLTARHADALVEGSATLGPVAVPADMPDVGAVTMGPAGLRSDTYGTLAFMTPILELDLDRVTTEESDLYVAWRAGYERNWAQVFDPIAARFTVSEERLAADVTVRPLIAGTDYRDIIEIVGGARLRPGAGDPHAGSLSHVVFAFDKEARAVITNEWLGMAVVMAPALDPLGWMGGAFAVYADQDPVWDALAASKDPMESPEVINRLPIALHADVSNGLKLAGFLAGLRAFIEQSAPDMLNWENRKHAGRTYVRISPTEMARADMGDDDFLEDIALYYAASGQGLVVSLNEELVKRSVARAAARRPSASDETADDADPDAAPTDEPVASARERPATEPTSEPAEEPAAWLGESAALTIDRSFLDVTEAMLDTQDIEPLAELSWGNLPILDEWRRRWPDEDPVEVHERLFKRRLIDPGGGTYRWNVAAAGMESSIYGHPVEPIAGPRLPPVLDDVSELRLGLTFEDDGVRARAELWHGDG